MKTYEFTRPSKRDFSSIWNKCYVPYLDTIHMDSFDTLESMYSKSFSQKTMLNIIDSLNLNIPKRESSAKMAVDIAARLMQPNAFVSFLYCLHDSCLDWLIRAVESNVPLRMPTNLGVQNMPLLSSGYVCVSEDGDTPEIIVPEDVKKLYREIAIPAFLKKRKQLRWLSLCLQACSIFHGITPSEIVTDIFNRNSEWLLSNEDIKLLAQEIPPELKSSKLIENDFVAFPFIRDNGLYDILECQSGKDYYIPSLDDIQKIGSGTYWGSSVYASNVLNFLLREVPENHNCRHLKDVIGEIEIAYSMGSTISESLDILSYFGVILPSATEGIRHLERWLLHLWSNTRMSVNRGHTPLELDGAKISNYHKSYKTEAEG